MADLERSEFLKRIGLPSDITVEPTQPQVEKASKAYEAARLAIPQMVPTSRFDLRAELGARPGVPFEANQGLPFLSRLNMEREPTKEEQLQALYREYGEQNVRLNKFGGPVVTTVVDGKETDVLANPLGPDIGDLTKVMNQSPELLGSIVPLVLTGGATLTPGVLNAVKTLLLSVGGQEAAGALKDVWRRMVNTEDQSELRLGEIAGRRSIEGLEGLVFGGMGGLATKVASKTITPFGQPLLLNFKANAAAEALNERHGTSLMLTAGGKTGSPLLLASESVQSKLPGSRSPFTQFREFNRRQMEKLIRLAGGGPVDEEEVGKRVVGSAKEAVGHLEFDVQLAAREAESAALDAIKKGIGAPVDVVGVGNSIGLGAKARKGVFDFVNRQNYDAFYANPLAKQRVVEGDFLKSSIDDMLKDLPAVEQTVQKPTGLLTATGAPGTRPVQQVVPIETPIRGKLEELSRKLNEGKVSINDLKGIRTDVDEMIKTGEAVPGVKPGRLKNLYSNLTQAIEQGLQDINDPTLTAAWKKATEYYSTNVGKFEKAGIAELFRDPINAMGPTEMVERAKNSADVYAAYKEFFGPNSPQVKGVQKSAIDDVLGLGNLGKTVEAQAFLGRLEELDKSSPELLKDALGPKAVWMRQEALAAIKAKGGNLPKAELEDALRSGSLSAQRLGEMLVAQERLDDAYRNSLLRDFSRGVLKPDRIKPTEVADRLVFNPKTQPQELEDLISWIGGKKPETMEDIRRLVFKKTLDKATVLDQTGNRSLDALRLNEILSDENVAKKLRATLGPRTWEDLVRIHDFILPQQVSQATFSSGGGLMGGMQVARLVSHGELKAVPQFVKNFLLASVYTSERSMKYFSNNLLSTEKAAVVTNLGILSEPWLRALVGTFLQEKAEEAQVGIKTVIDRAVMQGQATMKGSAGATNGAARPTTGNLSRDEFMRRIGLGATNQPAATP